MNGSVWVFARLRAGIHQAPVLARCPPSLDRGLPGEIHRIGSMGDLARLLSIFAATALLAFGATACGGDDNRGSTTTGAETEAATKPDRSQDTSGAGVPSGEQGKPDERSEDSAQPDTDRSGDSNFVPKQHDDSGGGSAQLRTKGGDNSVQEFGEEADESERAEAAVILHNFLDARAAEDWESACSFLAREVRESLEELAAQAPQAEEMSCAEVMAKLTNRAALPTLRTEAARADVGSLRIDGERAFILYRNGGSVLAVPMANEDGSWKVAGLAGTPLN
jgi:hypothetical protein